MATRVCPACCRGILGKYHGTRKIHEVKNNKDSGCAEELDVVDESDEEIKRDFRYNISKALGKLISSLQEIFRRIPLVPGL